MAPWQRLEISMAINFVKLCRAILETHACHSTDLFILSSDQTSLTVYRWDHRKFARFVFNIRCWRVETFAFVPLPQTSQIAHTDFVITNVVPGDLQF